MQTCGFGYRNRILDGVLTASAEAAGLPATNLTRPQGAPSLGWRVPGTRTSLSVRLSEPGPLRVLSLHRTNLTRNAVWTITILNGGAVVHTAQAPAGVANGQAIHIAPAEVTGDLVTLDLQDDRNPDGFLSLPLAYLGPLWQPLRNFSTQSTSALVGGVDEATALSGTEYPQPRWVQRKLTIAHQSYGAAEVPVLDALSRAGLSGGNVLFVPDPAAAAPADGALFGRLASGDLGNPFGAADRRALTFTLTERL